MSKQRVAMLVEFDADELKKIEFSAKTKVLGGDLMALDFRGRVFDRAELLAEALGLLADILFEVGLEDEHRDRLNSLLREANHE